MLSWSDIFVDAEHLDFQALLAMWPRTVSGRLQPIGASVFGDCFFLRPSGYVEKLDVWEGGVHKVAESFSEFQSLMNEQEWQEQNLLTEGVALLKSRKLLRGPGQFYAFAPHPAFTGKISWDRVMPMDAPVWHSICSQILDADSEVAER